MSFAVPTVSEPRRIPPTHLHLGFFSVLFLMLVSIAPSISWSEGSCSGTMAALEGPLLPVTV